MKVSARKIQIILHKKVMLADGICALYFLLPEGFNFIAGQYIQLALPHEADDRGTTRYFSIASAPSEKLLMLTIKNGESSFKKELFSLVLGAEIQAFGPIGSFTLVD